MPDWNEQIRKQLADLNLAPAREAEIVEELAQHAEDLYRELQSGGATQAEAARITEPELHGHELLARELRFVERPSPPELAVLSAGSRARLLAGLGQDSLRFPDLTREPRLHRHRGAGAGPRHRREYGHF